MMGAVTERSGGGVYKIAFSDGSEEDGIRYLHLILLLIGLCSTYGDERLHREILRSLPGTCLKLACFKR